MEPDPSSPPSDKLFQLVATARLVEDDADDEEKDTDMQMSLNPVVPSIDSLSIDDKFRDYFPILALPSHLLDLVFYPLPIKDRLALAGVNNRLNTIERESKYYVEELSIREYLVRPPPDELREIVFLESESYSSDCIRRIAHNASIGFLIVALNGSSDFHREVYNLIKEIDIGELWLSFEDKALESEMMVDSFLLGLARACKSITIHGTYIAPETIHEVYKSMLDGSCKLHQFNTDMIRREKCIAIIQLIGITYRDGTFFSNRNIEVYKEVEYVPDARVKDWHVFDGPLEMILEGSIFEIYRSISGTFDLIRHKTQKSLEEAKNKKGMEKIEIGPE